MSAIHDYGPMIAAVPVLAVIADVDRRTQRIPDRLSLLALAITVLAMTLLTLDTGRTVDLSSAGLGALILTSILGVLHTIRPDGLGMGDVKLALTLGLLLGWSRTSPVDVALMVAWCLMLASASGLLVVAVTVRRRSISVRGTAVPFGPSLCAGAGAVTLLGPTLLST